MTTPTREQLFEKMDSLKLFCLDNSFEIAFEKQFLVPYACIDIVADVYSEYGGYALYMILQDDKLKITGINMNNDPPIIEYKNCTTHEKHQIDNLWFFSFPVPRKALHMQIVSDTLLEVGIKDEWRRHVPQWQKIEPIKLNIYDLITQSQKHECALYCLKLLQHLNHIKFRNFAFRRPIGQHNCRCAAHHPGYVSDGW